MGLPTSGKTELHADRNAVLLVSQSHRRFDWGFGKGFRRPAHYLLPIGDWSATGCAAGSYFVFRSASTPPHTPAVLPMLHGTSGDTPVDEFREWRA